MDRLLNDDLGLKYLPDRELFIIKSILLAYGYRVNKDFEIKHSFIFENNFSAMGSLFLKKYIRKILEYDNLAIKIIKSNSGVNDLTGFLKEIIMHHYTLGNDEIIQKKIDLINNNMKRN